MKGCKYPAEKEFSRRDKLSLEYFDTETGEMKSIEMHVGDFKAVLK